MATSALAWSSLKKKFLSPERRSIALTGGLAGPGGWQAPFFIYLCCVVYQNQSLQMRQRVTCPTLLLLNWLDGGLLLHLLLRLLVVAAHGVSGLRSPWRGRGLLLVVLLRLLRLLSLVAVGAVGLVPAALYLTGVTVAIKTEGLLVVRRAGQRLLDDLSLEPLLWWVPYESRPHDVWILRTSE